MIARNTAILIGRLRAAAEPRALGWLAVAAAAVVTGSIAAGLAPLALKGVVDHLPPAREALTNLPWLIALYGLATFIQRASEQTQTLVYGRAELMIVRRFATGAFAHLLRLPLGLHHDRRSGALAQCLADGVLGLRLILTHVLMTALPVVVQLAVLASVVSVHLGGDLGLLLIIAVAAYAGVFLLGVRRLDRPMREVSAANLAASGAVTDSLMNVEAIKTFTAEAQYAQRYDAALGAAETQWRNYLYRRAEGGFAVALVFALTLSAGLWIVAGQAAHGRLTLGDVVLVNASILQIIRPIEMAGFAIRDIGQGVAYLGALSDLLSQDPEPEDRGLASPSPTGGAELVFDRVDFAFTPHRPTLQQISFRIAPGGTIALVGPSGAGKTSIARLLLGFYTPSAGDIRVDGRSISEMGLTALRSQIAVVAQDTILMNDTLAANIALGAKEPTPEALLAAATAAKLDGLLSTLPHGLDTAVGERGLKLSGGERQRVAIARAMLKDARLVVFDEATAALDSGTERAVWIAVKGLGRATRLIVTHRLGAVHDADEILVLDQGKIVERGSHTALLAQNGLYHQLWLAQAERAGSPQG